MDITSLSSSTQAGYPAKNPTASLSQFKAQQGGQLLSLLPSSSSSSSSSPGLGLNLDIYAAVTSQSQGLLSGGLTALEIANISLGIDMKASDPAAGTDAAAAKQDGGTVSPQGNPAATPAAAPVAVAHGNSQLDAILKEDGFVAAEKDPFVLQTDFFPQAAAAAPSTSSASPYFSNPSLSNPGLGGLLNSLG